MSSPSPQVYINGEWVPEEEARLHIFDSGLMYGEVLTETLRTFAMQPFRLEEHLARLRRSVEIARVEFSLPDAQLADLVHDLLSRNATAFDPSDELLIKIDVTRGIFFYYRQAGVAYQPYSLFLHVIRVPFEKFAHSYSDGVTVVTPPTRAIPSSSIDPRVKHRSRLHQGIAQLEAADVDPDAVAVLLDGDGYVAEGAGANVFAVRGGRLLTPTTDNCLEGISRASVIDLANQAGIPVAETRVRPYDIVTADEAFLTATSYCMLPIARWDGQTVGTDVPGPMFQRLIQAWGGDVGIDIIRQAEALALYPAAPGQTDPVSGGERRA